MAHSELYWSVYKANLLERIRTWTESNPGRLLEAFNDLAEPLKLQASLCKHIFGCHTSSSEASCFYYLYPRSPPSQSHFVLFPHWGTIWDRCYITREDAEHVKWTERKSFAVPRFPIKVSVPTYLISFEVELQKKKVRPCQAFKSFISLKHTSAQKPTTLTWNQFVCISHYESKIPKWWHQLLLT